MKSLNPVRRTIIVGIGATGEDVVRELHRRLDVRHEGVPPVVRFMLLREAWDIEKSHSKFPMPSGVVVVPVDWRGDTARINALNAQNQLNSWLPKLDDLSLASRAGARLALFQCVHKVRAGIEKLMTAIAQNAVQADLATRDLEAERELSTYFFLVGALDDPLFSGTFIDLAYLLDYYDRADQRDRTWYGQSEQYRCVTGVLVLPFVSADGDAVEPGNLARVQREAEAYAALKELDYYLTGTPYRCEYAQEATEAPLVVEAPPTYPPFKEGACYLVGQFNENGRGLPDPADAAGMTAEWLYQWVASPASARLAPRMHAPPIEGKVSRYSGLGAGGYFFPAQAIQDYCVARLTWELVHECLRQKWTAAPDRDVDTLQATLELLPTQIDARLQDQREWTVRMKTLGIDVAGFDDIPMHEAAALESRLDQRYTEQRSQVLPAIERGLRLNRENILSEENGAALTREVHHILDSKPVGGLDRVQRLITELYRRCTEEAEKTRQNLEASGQKLTRAEEELKRWRQLYFAMAGIFGRPILEGTPLYSYWLMSLYVFAVVGYYTWKIVGEVFDLQVLAGVLIGVSGLAALFVTGRLYRWIAKHARGQFIGAYDARLRAVLEQSQYSNLGEVYDGLGRWMQELTAMLGDLQQRLTQLEESLADDLEAAKDANALYGWPYYSLEKSAVTEKDVTDLYHEVAPNLEEKLQALLDDKHHGPYHLWATADERFRVPALRDALRAYAAEQAKCIGEHRVSEYLQALPGDDLRKQFLGTLPYWQCAEMASEVQRAVAIDVPEPDLDTNSLVRACRQAAPKADPVLTRDAHHLTLLSVRHGLPLFAVSSLTPLRRSYETMCRVKAGLQQIHNTRGHIALPDILPEPQKQLPIPLNEYLNLDPRTCFTLAMAFNCLEVDTATGRFAIQYVDPLFADTVEAVQNPLYQKTLDLGATRSEACHTLYQQPEALERLRQSVTGAVKAQIPTGDPVELARFLVPYLREHHKAGDLDDWEESILSNYLESVRRAVAKAGKTADEQRPEIPVATGA